MTQPKREVIKRGTNEWWTWLAIFDAVNRRRKAEKLPRTAPVTIDLQDCNKFIRSVNRNPFKRIWLLMTVGDLHPLDRDKIGNEIGIKAEDGVVREFFRPER